MKTSVLSFLTFMVFLIVISTISCSKHGKVVDTASIIENAFEIEGPIETFAAYRVYEQDGRGEYAGPVKIMETLETNIDCVEGIKPADPDTAEPVHTAAATPEDEIPPQS
jgi:hypothetical protein